MAGSSILDQALLSLLLTNATASLAGIGDAAGLQPSLTAGALFLSLHTASPGKDGNQATGEMSYGAYARVPVARAATSWLVAGAAGALGSAWNLTAIQFAADTGVSAAQTASYVGIGTQASGTGYLLLLSALSAPVVITSGYIPLFPSASLLILCD